MAYKDFLTRLSYYKNISVEELSTNPSYRYAVQCRVRGAQYIPKINSFYNGDISSLKLLDIGCAYGGIAIELKKAGAQLVAGVDVVPSYIDLAKHNAKADEEDIDFYIGDLTLRSTMMKIKNKPNSKFNFFILNHVLEHIYDTEGLLQNIDDLAEPNSIIFFDVPNGFSIQSFLSEGHTRIFGVSLNDPDCWHYYGKERARIYYRRLGYYKALFSAHGYTLSLVRSRIMERSQMENTLKTTLLTAQKSAKLSIAPLNVVNEAIERFESEVNYDINYSSDEELDLKYFHYFWTGVAYKCKDHIKKECQEQIPQSLFNL